MRRNRKGSSDRKNETNVWPDKTGCEESSRLE